MPSFVSLAEYEAQFGDVDDETAVSAALEQATRLIQMYTGQTIFLVADDEIVLDGNDYGVILLPEWPVVAIESVVVDVDTELVYGNDEDYVWSRTGQLRNVGGKWGFGLENITVTYTHGYADIPDDIKLRTMQIARAIVSATSGTAESGATIRQETVGGYSVTYADDGTSVSSDALIGGDWEPLNFYRTPQVV